MFRCVCRLTSTTTTIRRRASNVTLRAAACPPPATKKPTSPSSPGGTPPACVLPAFKTKDFARALQLSLPPTADILTIDNTAEKTSGNVSSILRFVVTHYEEVSRVQADQPDSHPLVLVVHTSLGREDAETNELVLSSAFQQRDRLKDITAIVLDARQSSVAKSVLKNHKHRSQLGMKKSEPPVKKAEDAGCNTAEAGNVKSENHKTEGEVKRQPPAAKKAVKSPNPEKTPAATVSALTAETTTTTVKKETKTKTVTQTQKASSPPPKKEEKKDDRESESDKGSSVSLSYTPPPGAVKVRSTSVPPTRNVTRESLRQMFRSSLAAPFQPSNQVERTLFTGYVDKLRLSDLLNLPVYGGGEVYALYYRLTGAGACRTPLITIAHIMEEEHRRKMADRMQTDGDLAPDTVPMLVLLGVSFLISEDARLMCQEYQKALKERLSMMADVTVVAVPTCFTEKNVLFALRSAEVESHSAVGGGKDPNGDEDTREVGDKPLPPINRRSGGSGGGADGGESVHRPEPSFSENVLRSVVTNALEEVALRHEKSTDHLVSTLNKLVAYWSRERVMELMESLQNEREALLDTAKELEEVQRQLRDTKGVMETLRNHMKDISEKVGRTHDGEKDAASCDLSELAECVRDLESRLARALSEIPSKKQITLDIREELERVQKSFKSNLDQSLTRGLKEAQERQSRDLQQALKRHTSANGDERQLTQQCLQELPQKIQSAMETALKSVGQHAAGRTTGEEESPASQTSVLCEKLCRTIEAGQERMERALVNVISARANNDGVMGSQTHATGGG